MRIGTDRDTWPELAYRFVEHYKWEPQWLYPGKPASVFYRSITRQEVPLNFLLNLLLQALPDSWMRQMLGAFTGTSPIQISEPLSPRFPHEIELTQPDALIESASHRVFIECKVDARLDRTQLEKYLALSAHIDQTETPKRPWLLLLTRRAWLQHWAPPADRKTFGSDPLRHLQASLTDCDTLPACMASRAMRPLVDRYHDARRAVRLGHATWQELGDALAAAVVEAPEHDYARASARMVAGFLTDLDRRGLWRSV